MTKEYERTQLEILKHRILEPRKFLQVVVGPRQVGKTTILNQLFKKNLIYTAKYAVDDISTANGEWLDGVWEKLRVEMRSQGKKEALLIIDEIQRINDWSLTVKKNWDADTSSGINIKLILSGSSRLLLQRGLHDSLLGRYELIRIGHWSYREMEKVFNFTPEQFVWFGGYPGAATLIDDEMRFKNYVKDSVVSASINQDILMLTQIVKPALLRQLFELGCSYNSQILSYNKLLGQLQDAGNTVTLAKYLELLEQAGLLSGLETFSRKVIKTRSSSPKFQVFNMGLVSAGQTETFSDALADKLWWGRLVESAVGAHLLNLVNCNTNAQLFYWREGELEVDFVLKYGAKILGIEVKSSDSEMNMPSAMRFKEKFPESEILLVGDKGVKWQKFLRMDLGEIFPSTPA
ncbi:ATP-binding protein [Candidatus Saccharibacteria bacterium]|nr:ATP-binding protein [Candidatus Saccharibacteria bacterium]